MHSSKKIYIRNPKENAGNLSKFLYYYTFGMFRNGLKKVFEIDDLYNPLECDRSVVLGDRLESNWNKAWSTTRKPNLILVVLKTFQTDFIILGLKLAFYELILNILQPIVLGKFLEYFKVGGSMPKSEAMFYASCITVLNILAAVVYNHYMYHGRHMGIKARIAVSSLVYRKALKLNVTALNDVGTGKIINLLSNDLGRFDFFFLLFHYLWIAPLSVCIVTTLLYLDSGYAGIIGLIPMILAVFYHGYAGKLSSKYRSQTAYHTDKRVRLMDEVISGIQVIKMYAWEKPFQKLIFLVRKKELNKVVKINFVRGMFLSFRLFIPRLALFCTLITLVCTDQQISAKTVFVFIAYFNVLSTTLSTKFARAISETAETLVAVKRLSQYFTYSEFDKSNGSHILAKNEINAIEMEKISAGWHMNGNDEIIKNITLEVPKGHLIGVIGAVGSGKSTLLHTMLGETNIISGSISTNGEMSYAAQESWLFTASIRQNIIFGSQYKEDRYRKVVNVCALTDDLASFSEGDATIISDRGASLSGGQKARLTLARAIYKEADIYLLDDPLSAVDVAVAKHLFEECIMGFLSNKTRILVTHQVAFLKDADKIFILNEGNLQDQGDYHYLNLSGTQFNSADNDELLKDGKSFKNDNAMKSVTTFQSQPTKYQNMHEKTSKGTVAGSMFIKYFTSSENYCLIVCVFLTFLISQGLGSAIDYFVSYWTNLEERRTTENVILSTEQCLYITAGLILAIFIGANIRSVLFYKLAMESSQKLHDGIFKSVVYTTMRFFNCNPTGRILNRFAKDLGNIDEMLPKAVIDAGHILLVITASVLLVVVVSPWMLVLLTIISCGFHTLRHIYLKTSKNIKRLDGMTKSAVFTHLTGTLQGLPTIRAYQAELILKQQFDQHQDLNTSALFMFICASSAFGFYLELLCSMFTGFVTFSFLLIINATTGGNVGLAITQVTSLTGVVQWGMRQSADIANQLTSVERVLEYSQLEEEPQPLAPVKIEDSWPRAGAITFKDVTLKYASDLPDTLKRLTFEIPAGYKIGIVGRTGAGKSSMIAAMLRLAMVDGQIIIDGIDTKNVILQELRSRIAVIPQDPVLFSGSLRYNLDPFDEHSDEVLWKALEDVELKDSQNIINSLDYKVTERGANYSVGQRQLICLARAIIRKNKILLLDEATANVDSATDALIQNTIRKKFGDSTVLTIAHRLNTIMDSDKILVLDSGIVLEYDHPHQLLQDQNSRFCQMVESSGDSAYLKNVAKESYENKNRTM